MSFVLRLVLLLIAYKLASRSLDFMALEMWGRMLSTAMVALMCIGAAFFERVMGWIDPSWRN